MSEDRRTITASEAEATLGIPASTVRAWAAAAAAQVKADPDDEGPTPTRPVFAVGIREDGQVEYDLEVILKLATSTKRRAKHTRPSRRATGIDTAPGAI